ncbi:MULTISPECIES: hypothetical protein [Nocardia]|uniref:hypothetical protein n=1 Tax=Nocardia TaxID=1817 RepID=UPI00255C3352|nr:MULTISPECIES: hypothetical protein [Nocardia]
MARHGALLLGISAALLLISAGPAAAGPVTIRDDSNVLDDPRVTAAADTVPDPVQIFTTERLAENNAAFDQEAQSHVHAPNDVVIAINTKSRHLTIRTGANSHIRDASPAIAAFKSGFGNGDYTTATVGALESLARAADQAAPASRAHRPTPAPPAASRQDNGFNLWSVLCPLIVIAMVIAAVVAFRRRGRGAGFPDRGNPSGGYGPGGYDPGGRDPGQDPGDGQRHGMSPGVAGGLGAAAGAVGGGVLGYELGRMEGREEERAPVSDQPPPDSGPDQPPQEWGGGGGDGDFGGGGDSGGGSGGSDSGGFDSGSSGSDSGGGSSGGDF